MAELRIGTCSWKYPSWKGLVYSAAGGINYLAEYAEKYRTVEVDQWFWSLFRGGKAVLPKPDDVQEYRTSVPDDFRFSVKVPNSLTLTHYYKKSKSDPLEPNPYFLSLELFAEFLSRLEPIRDQLGPLIFQFEYLNKQKMKSQQDFIERFEAFANRLPPSLEYAIEIRNSNYLNRKHFEFLIRNRLSPVFLQGYWMPLITETYQAWSPLIAEQDRVVLRLHGPGREDIEKITKKRWNNIVDPHDDELRAVVEMIADLEYREVDVYLNVNNHYEGSSPLTIDRFNGFLAEKRDG